MNINELRKSLYSIYKRDTVPDKFKLLNKLDTVSEILKNESEQIRPRNSKGISGGLIYLNEKPTLIIPDIHARVEFLPNILIKDFNKTTVLDALDNGELQIICVGDALHGEKRVAERWEKAVFEFRTGYLKHNLIDQEIIESFTVMETVIELKTAYPENFHFLKGNHENIKNEEDGGNHPFRKYAEEGEMIKHYVEKKYGSLFLNSVSDYEKNLPLFAVGKEFLISHAEPGTFYTKDMIINSYKHPQVIHDLTWTANGEAEDDSVEKMLQYYLGDIKNSYYFGGHRTIPALYNLRAEGKFVQINNPNQFTAALICSGSDFNMEKDIFYINPDQNLEERLLNG